MGEDPSFRTKYDEENAQTIISGMGELHLEIIVDRLQREFGVEANVGAPQVSYREAITAPAEVDFTHKKQSGGSGQYARCKVQFAPLEGEESADFVFARSRAAPCRRSTSRACRRASKMC